MNAGRMEQFGTPEEVYQRPASTFVASFIGSPPMNLIEGVADGQKFKVGDMTLPLPAAAPRSGALVLGLRPEHATLVEHGGADGWALQVEVVEMLGAERLVYCRMGTSLFTVRIDGQLSAPAPGQTLHLSVNPERLHWFDSKTGGRL